MSRITRDHGIGSIRSCHWGKEKNLLLVVCLVLFRVTLLVVAAPFSRQHNHNHLPTATAATARHKTLWGIRGGGNDDNDDNDTSSFYTAVGVQVVGKSISEKIAQQWSSNFVLLKGATTLRPPSNTAAIWNGDIAAVESLAICCDFMVIVVVLPNDNQSSQLLDPNFVEALERGLKHRATKNMLSSVLLLLVTDNDSDIHNNSSSDTNTNTRDPKLSYEKDRLVSQDLSNLTPNLVAILDLLSLDDPHECTVGLDKAMKGILRDLSFSPQHTISQLVEPTAFPRLLQNVYQSQGGTNSKYLALLAQDLKTTTTSSISHDGGDKNVPYESGDHSGGTNQEDLSIPLQEQPDGSTTIFQNDGDEALLESMLKTAQLQLGDLEIKQDLLWLGYSSTDSAVSEGGTEQTPQQQSKFDFGTTANKIIETYEAAKHHLDTSCQPIAHDNLWRLVLPRLKQRYDQHLQYLREQYGKQYEEALEETEGTSKEDVQSKWKEAAAQATEAFRTAAQAAVPTQCRQGGKLRDANFDYIPALEGLLSDMMQATEDQQDLLGLQPQDDDEEDLDNDDETAVQDGGRRIWGRRRRRQRRGPAKWYEKVAAKAFVFAVNYFQGWLAYQGIKRAAAQRDQHLPKFPLF